MADKDTDLQLTVGAVADKKSAEQAAKDITKQVESSVKGGRIEVPVDITVPIDKTKSNLTKAQKDVTTKLSKLMTKGFSASAKDIDDLVSKFDEFTKAFDQAGKGRQNKIFKEIRKQVEELQKSYKSLKLETSGGTTKVSKTSRSKKSKKTAEDRYLEQQEEYSRKSQGAGKRAELKKELDYVRENKSLTKSSSVKPSATNEHLMRLSEYSAYGSNWASELSRILKEEMAKSAKTLVTYIDPIYAKKTKGGRATTEKEFLSATFNDVRKQLKESVAQLESGSEDVTLDLLKEQVAVMKVLGKEVGKTTEQIEKSISSAIQSRYSHNETNQIGGTSLEEGQIKGVGPGHENTQKILTELYDVMKQWDSEVVADNIAKEVLLSNEKTVKTIEKGRKKVTGSQTDKKVTDIKLSDDYKTELQKLNSASDKTFGEIRKSTTATEKQANIDKIENVREAVSDSNVEKTDKENKDINRDTARAVKVDETTGFNTNTKSDELISLVRSILQQLQLIAPEKKKTNTTTTENKEETDTQNQEQDKIAESIKTGTVNDYSMEMKKAWDTLNESIEPVRAQMALIPVPGTFKNHWEGTDIVNRQRRTKEIEKERKKQLEEASKSDKVEKSNIYASPLRQGFWKSIEGAFERLTGATRRYEEVLRANAEDQDKLAAERIKTYGLNNGRNPNDTGDIAGMRRILQLYRTNKASIEQNPELMQKIQLTKGREVDTTEITKVLNKALSGRQMKNAQNGGGFLKNAFGFMTGGLGYAFMPSLEKSRAQADGLNQVLGNVNKALQSVLINIQTKETELAGMEESGQAKFDKNGYLMPGSSSAAYKTLADLEEEKLVLDSIKADLLANDEIIEKTGGRFPQMVKYLNFTSPVLKENNGILRNINSGLDKNGKALKFQNRLAEILNYTYQLMSRSIGQMIKNWITMANPINLIKKAFSDFGSYDVKWQRTMNVIKINFQRIIKPAMEWIAQKLVNIIGFFDIVSQRIQAAFGKIPISLFDQAGAESEQIRRNLEEAANVSLGFDELHDVGTDQSGANDLTGDIYKPQLSQDWIDMATKLGDTLGGFFKGDLGFGDVCKVILELLGKLLGTIGKMIWDWFKETSLGKWITEHWKGLLATLLTLFVGWQLLKIAGPTLLKALFGWITGGKIGGILSTLGTKFMDVFTSTQFGSDMVRGFKGMFTSKGMIGAFKSGGASLGTIFAQALVAVAGVAIATGSMVKGFDMIADDTSYNVGLMETGGDKKDKKSGAGGAAVSILGGAAGGALAGLAVGGPIGAAIGAGIGAIAGTFTSVLAPAIEKTTITAKTMNNELQKIEYYEGKVKGAQTQVDKFDELLNISNQTLQAQSDKVYALGEKYGVSKTRLDSLVQAMKDGNYNSEMAVGLNTELSDALTQLDWHYQNNESVTNKLTEAKKKLQQAELDLSIAEDINAGNFEMATARIEYAMAAGLYSTDEAAKKMAQILKETSYTEGKELLNNVSPDLQKKFTDYNAITTEQLRYYADKFHEASKEERDKMLKDFSPEVRDKFLGYLGATAEFKRDYIDYYNEANEEMKKIITDPNVTREMEKAGERNAEAIRKGLQNATTWDKFRAWWADILPGGKTSGDIYAEVGSRSGVRIQKNALGTNYVEADGLQYLHQGEAIIPKKYNQPYQPGGMSAEERAYMDRMIATMNRLDGTIAQGISVKGEFRQRGNDLVATVEKARTKNGNQVLNNPAFAR